MRRNFGTIDDGTVTRYVLTCVWNPGEGRQLFEAMQGRFTHGEREACEERRASFLENGSLASHYPHAAETLEVRPVQCWPGHFDPITRWFESPEECEARVRMNEEREAARNLGREARK